jgi:hypothetical protein
LLITKSYSKEIFRAILFGVPFAYTRIHDSPILQPTSLASGQTNTQTMFVNTIPPFPSIHNRSRVSFPPISNIKLITSLPPIYYKYFTLLPELRHQMADFEQTYQSAHEAGLLPGVALLATNKNGIILLSPSHAFVSPFPRQKNHSPINTYQELSPTVKPLGSAPSPLPNLHNQCGKIAFSPSPLARNS